MPAKCLWANAALMALIGVTGCCSWCENHCPHAQPAVCCQPCTPYYPPANNCCQAPAYSPCYTPPPPSYAPPAQPWVQPAAPAPAR